MKPRFVTLSDSNCPLSFKKRLDLVRLVHGQGGLCIDSFVNR